MLEHVDEWATLEDFISGEPTFAERLPDEVTAVLASYPSEADLEAYLTRLGSCYTTDEPGGYRGWLTEVARRVRAATSS